MSNDDVLEQYRREVTPEEAGLALLAAHLMLRHKKPMDAHHLRNLMALAVEKHTPKREEAQRGAER